jgi:hypothetical protein
MNELPYNTNKYLLVFGSLLIIIIFLYLASSNSNKFSCDVWANDFRDNAKFHLVLAEKENHESRDAYFYGTELHTKDRVRFYDGGGWIAGNFDKFRIGDTLIKDAGKYTIIIKRKGKTVLIPFECNGKIYDDK